MVKPNQQINRFFNNSAMKAALKPKPAPVSLHHNNKDQFVSYIELYT
jgi:hypothetical protein